MTEIKDVPTGSLYPHPDNPRLQLREDVIERLAAEIERGGFGREHAPLVRPYGDGFQIVSGHHRIEAATRAGLDTVPCWVKDMDDDEAFMQLVLSNTQGELSGLEIGMHALRAVPLAEGGRGKKGGLSEYAADIRRQKGQISEWRSAAIVADTVLSREQYPVSDLDSRTKHLYEISKAPRETWPTLVESLVAKKWTVADTGRQVAELKKFEIPEQHAEWLDGVTLAYLRDGRPTSSAVARLVSTVDGIIEHIGRDGTDDDAQRFRDWLLEHKTGDSWDHRKVSRYHADLIVEWADRDADVAGGRLKVYQCSAIDLLGHLDPGSVDLIFTDPPYPAEFVDCWSELGDLAVKALKPGGLLLAYSGQHLMLEAADRLRRSGLTYRWCNSIQHDGAFFRMYVWRVQCGWKPVWVFQNGDGGPPRNWHKDVVTEGSREKSTTADGEEFDGGTWQQAEAEAAYWIGELTEPDALVVDPFTGSGTTAAVCKELGRRFIGCDVDEKAVESARRRLA